MPGKIAEHGASAGTGILGALGAVAVILNFFSDSMPFADKGDLQAAQTQIESLQKEVHELKAVANKLAWELAWERYGDASGPPPPPELFTTP